MDQLRLEIEDLGPRVRGAQERIGEAPHQVQQGVGAPELRGVQAGALALGDAGQVHHLEARRRDLLWLVDRGQLVQARIGHARHPGVELGTARVEARRGHGGPGEQFGSP
jgi:hypothetical protein